MAKKSGPAVDGAMIGQFITLYLRGIYTLKGGRLSAKEAADHVVKLIGALDAMRTKAKKLLG